MPLLLPSDRMLTAHWRSCSSAQPSIFGDEMVYLATNLPEPLHMFEEPQDVTSSELKYSPSSVAQPEQIS